MPGIFISYRREDSAPSAGRLYDHLVEHFGKEHVFRDIDTIAPGAEFAKVIEESIGKCDVLIAVIGRDWLRIKDVQGQRRLDDPDDLVKAEIREALSQNKRVIPVLVEGASMSVAADLPPEIAAFAGRNAIEISESRFDYDVGRLIEAVASTAELADKAVQDDAGNINEASLGEVFDALSEVDESGGVVRRRAWVDDFSPAAQGLVQRLIKARLLTSDREPKTGRAWVEVAHEAVLREWPRFSTWLKDYGAFKLWRKGLNEARAHWLKQGRASAELLLGARLKEALIKRNERPLLLTLDENEFILRSRVQRWVTGLKLVFTVLPVLVGGYLLWKEYEDLTHRAVYYLALAQLGQWHSLQPDMVTIPPDRECSPGRPCTFQMGSPPDQCAERKEECPQHEVTFRKPFKLGKYEVTFDEYEVFLRWIGQDGGCKDGHQLGKRYRQKDFGFGRGGRPVINVSWEDAQCYAEWLSGKTGNRYRLPTEAEWEYAARAGSSEDYFWGESADQAGDYAWFSGNSDSMTQPVGRKRPNGFGLYDTAGNVWEWVEDCYHENYDQAPSDGHQAWGQENGDDCDARVIRGGSWGHIPEYLRSALRVRNFPDYRTNTLGFRLAQDP